VLLIEDDEDIRAATVECLEEEGFTVVGAESADEGLAQLRGGLTPTVILLDLMMPDRTGWDFRRDQLADRTLRNIPVIVLSASRIGEDSLRQRMGHVDLVPKPFSIDTLLEAIARAISPPVAGTAVTNPLPGPASPVDGVFP